MKDDNEGYWLGAVIGFAVGMIVGAFGMGVLAYLLITWANEG